MNELKFVSNLKCGVKLVLGSLEGTARYAGLLLSHAEGFGLWTRFVFLPVHYFWSITA